MSKAPLPTTYQGNEIVLQPGVVLEVETYSDEQIAAMSGAERVGLGQRP